MAHFALTKGTWVGVTILDPADLGSLDVKTSKAVNGDEGGVWAPSSVIEIGGSGLTLAGLNHFVTGRLTASAAGAIESTVAGGIRSAVVGGISAATAGGITGGVAGGIVSGIAGGIQLSGGPNDHITLASPRTRTLVRSIPKAAYRYVGSWSYSAVASHHNGVNASGEVVDLEIFPPDGSTIYAVFVYYKTSGGYSALPTTMPSMRVWRHAFNGLGVTDLYSGGAQDFTAANVGAWNSGSVQSFTVFPDQNNVVDRGAYSYGVTIRGSDGGGGTMGVDYISINAQFTYSDLRPQ